MRHIILVFALAAACARAQVPAPANGEARPTLTLTPAVASAKLKPGQGWTQVLHLRNGTAGVFRFEVQVQDVVVKDGKRTYVPGGETESSIAASAVITPRSLSIGPGEEGSASVTLTIPLQTALRAVVIYFRGKLDTPSEDGMVGLGASLGALVTFDLSGDYNFKVADFSTSPQTETANQVLSHEVLNSGLDVVLPKGGTVILDESGRSVGKATFPAHRILPGESVTFSATCPSQLKSGHYRVVSSFEFNSRIVTGSGEFSVP
jgi:hypothetical protein